MTESHFRGEEEPAEIYTSLRRQKLQLTRDDFGPEAAEAPVLAVLMETRHPGGVATLVGIVDGTTSLHLSNGGGVIGAGEDPAVAAATEGWLRACAALLTVMQPVGKEPQLPGAGMTQFIAVTPDGLRGGATATDDLKDREFRLHPLFRWGHHVLAAVRKTQGA